MKIAGFISEFNPFHNGHEYFINKIKEDNVDLIITAMSPNFVMRGEPSIFDKMKRCEAAVRNGVDVVLEIPTPFALNSADIYAKAGLDILMLANITDFYFGSEIEDIEIYNHILSLETTSNFKDVLNKFMKDGFSFNASYKKALIYLDDYLKEYLEMPNLLLGLQYIKYIKENNLNVNIHIIKRVDAMYYDEINKDNNIQSASAIREEILKGNGTKYISDIFDIKDIHVKNDYFKLIKYKLISSSLQELKEINGVSEGLESLLKKSSCANTIEDLTELLVSKRNREIKINRILFSLLLNIKKNDIKQKIDYIRVLGLSSLGTKHIKTLTCNVYTNIKRDIDIRVLKELTYTSIYDIHNSNLEKNEYKPFIF